jgi:hypothetical protein
MYCSVRVIAHFKGFMIDIINMAQWWNDDWKGKIESSAFCPLKNLT